MILAVCFKGIGGKLFVPYLWSAEWAKWWAGMKRVVGTSTVKCLTPTIEFPMNSTVAVRVYDPITLRLGS